MTATTTVTLEEVIAAAGCRRAALAPETSGYFALAIGDATSRLPLRIEDRAISLTTEGTVMVPRKGDLTAPADAARTLREVLARLLAVSAGSMPGLAQAARPRAEADVDGVVAGIEAALIPVNRAAARRALARLARETVRARDRGKLRGLTMASLVPDAPHAPLPAPSEAAPAPPAAPAQAPLPQPDPALENMAPEVRADVAPVPAEATHATNGGVEAVFEASDTPQPYAPRTDEASAPLALGATSPIEAAPVEPVAAMPEATEAPLPMESEAPAPAPSEDFGAPSSAPAGDVGTVIVPAPILTVRGLSATPAADAERPIPPSRVTTPTITGVGDVGVYIAAALEPSARRYELTSADRTAPWPCVRLGGATSSTASEESTRADDGGDAAHEARTCEAPSSIAGDLGDVPVAPSVALHDDDDTNIEMPLVRAEPVAREEPSFPRIAAGITAIAPTPQIRMPIEAPAALRETPRARAARTTRFGLGPARGGADLAPTEQSSVDDLLARFNIAGVRDERRVARTLKTFAGLDVTAAPPIVWESPRPEGVRSPLPPSVARREDMLPPPSAKPARAARLRLLVSAAIVVFGLFGTVTLWHRRAEIFRARRAAMPAAAARPTLPPMPAEEPHAGVDP